MFSTPCRSMASLELSFLKSLQLYVQKWRKCKETVIISRSYRLSILEANTYGTYLLEDH